MALSERLDSCRDVGGELHWDVEQGRAHDCRCRVIDPFFLYRYLALAYTSFLSDLEGSPYVSITGYKMYSRIQPHTYYKIKISG